MALVCIAAPAVVYVAMGMAPVPENDAEPYTEYRLMQVPPPPDSNLTGFEDDWRTRDGKCLGFAILFISNNQDWTLISGSLVDPLTEARFSHMFAARGEVAFDPVAGLFFDRQKYYEFFHVTNTTEYEYN